MSRTSSRGGWARALLYNQVNQEIDRITGPTHMGDDGIATTRDEYPFTLRGLAPTQPGTYTWQAAWYGSRNDNNHTDTREVRVSTNQFTVVAPSGSVTINAGAPYTTAPAVTLALSASGPAAPVTAMRLSNDGTTWTVWESYVAGRLWDLTSGDGVKTVYVQYRDSTAYVTPSYTDTIVLDATVPTGGILINSGDQSTTSTTVTLTLSATDAGSGPSQMSFCDDEAVWTARESYATTRTWTLAPIPGERTVFARFRDVAGNVSPGYSDSIRLDMVTSARRWKMYR